MTLQQPLRAVLFDLDGTLIDTAPDFIRIIRLMCQQASLDPPHDDLIRAQVSEGARAMVSLMYPDLAMDSPQLLQMRQQFLHCYAQNIAVDTCLFAGMDALLDSLDKLGLPWGIVTNKPRSLSVALLAALQLTQRCQVLVCPDDVTCSKPDPEPMLLAARQLGLPPEQIIYVGDHPRDIEAGRAAHMPTVLAAYGYLPPGHRDDLDAWQASHIVSSVDELMELIHQLTHHLLTEPNELALLK